MAQHRLGQQDHARATFERLLQRMKNPTWAQDQEAQGFLAETEALIRGRPAMPKLAPRLP